MGHHVHEKFYRDGEVHEAGQKKFEKYKKEPGYKFLTPVGQGGAVLHRSSRTWRARPGCPSTRCRAFEYPASSVPEKPTPTTAADYPLEHDHGCALPAVLPHRAPPARTPTATCIPTRSSTSTPTRPSALDIRPGRLVLDRDAQGPHQAARPHHDHRSTRASSACSTTGGSPEKEQALPSLFGAFESNANVLLDDDPDSLDQLIGAWQQTGVAARVYKCEEQDR